MSAAPQWIIRIDDRLIHGQVCVGWCDALGIRRLVLADDAVAASYFERELYSCCPGEGQRLEFWRLEELAAALAAPPPATTMAVLAGPAEARRLLELGAPLREVQVGGLHHQPGARELADYLFVTAAQEADLRALLAAGVRLVGQPLPASPRLELERLLRG